MKKALRSGNEELDVVKEATRARYGEAIAIGRAPGDDRSLAGVLAGRRRSPGSLGIWPRPPGTLRTLAARQIDVIQPYVNATPQPGVAAIAVAQEV